MTFLERVRASPGRVLSLMLVPLAVAATPTSAQRPDQPFAQERVMASLNRTLAWYRDARVAMRASGVSFTRDDVETAIGVLRRAFDVARAQQAVLALEAGPAPAPQPGRPFAEKRAEVQAAIENDRQELGRIQKRLRTARGNQHEALQRELTAAANRLQLDTVRLDFLARFEQFETAAPRTEPDLAHQIDALQESVPELRSGAASTDTGTPRAAAGATPTALTSGTWALVHRLVALQRTRGTLDQLAQTTARLERSIDSDFRATQAALQPIIGRLRSLTIDPAAGGSVADGQRTFQDLLEHSKRLGTVLLSLRAESALLHRYSTDLDAWQGTVDRDTKETLQSFAIGLIGVAVALAAIFAGAVLWRVAVDRYVCDPYHRRLAMSARNALAAMAIALVLVFHFASELTALVTGLGFAAAGIAFALQNVILAVAGYFSMVAPNGIRVGDRVSLQGPFGYVQGDVVDIGLVRIRLRELAGDPLRPTGRIVVFPNSVVFTGSFFKNPPPEERAETPRPMEPGAAA